MKAKRRSSARKRTPTHGKKRRITRSTARVRHAALTVPVTTPPATIAIVKTCQEVEVGDIGGFGSPEAFEAHEKRCGQAATEFCNTCARNLCRNHYELLHMDHDTGGGHTPGQGLTGQ